MLSLYNSIIIGFISARAAESFFPGTTNLTGWFLVTFIFVILLTIMRGD